MSGDFTENPDFWLLFKNEISGTRFSFVATISRSWMDVSRTRYVISRLHCPATPNYSPRVRWTPWPHQNPQAVVFSYGARKMKYFLCLHLNQKEQNERSTNRRKHIFVCGSEEYSYLLIDLPPHVVHDLLALQALKSWHTTDSVIYIIVDGWWR